LADAREQIQQAEAQFDALESPMGISPPERQRVFSRDVWGAIGTVGVSIAPRTCSLEPESAMCRAVSAQILMGAKEIEKRRQ
jgi:hypothetical protein